MTRQSSSTLRATALIAILALLWGSSFFWIKLALDGLTPTQLTFARLALGVLVLVPIVVARRLALPRTAAMWGHLAVSALVANAIPYTLFAVAEQTTSSSLAGVINSTTPLWTVLIAYAVGTERLITRTRLAGLIVGFLGVLVVISPWAIPLASTPTGLLACVGAAASYGVAYVYQARYLTNRGHSPLVLTAAQLAVAAALITTTLPISGTPPQPTATAITAVLVLGVAGTGVALVINFMLIATEGPTSASVVTYLLPAVAVALGVLILAEPVTWSLPIGAALILGGVALVRRTRSHGRGSTRAVLPS
jgi:drug/metabolite transporter (DMT)-like permease